MNWKIIARSLKSKDMQRRIFAVLGIIVIFRFLAQIPIPIAEPEQLKQVIENALAQTNSSQLLGFLNILSGGALASFSIMIVGLGPYINASIIMQLLTKAIPKMEALNKEGEYGRKKIQQWTRLLTLPLAIVQSIGTVFLVGQTVSQVGGLGDLVANASLSQWVLMVAVLTASSMLLMFLGEIITEQGIGNGISLVITVGIVASLPAILWNLISSVIQKESSFSVFGFGNFPINSQALWITLAIAVVTIVVTVLVVYLNEAQRRITINYAKRLQGNRVYGGITTTLPLRLITAGVIPIIFAGAFLALPEFVGRLLSQNATGTMQEIGEKLVVWFQIPTSQSLTENGIIGWLYPIVYFLLVFMFTFFYTSVVFNAKEISENLQKQGGFINGIRPGKPTEKYLMSTVNKLTLFGALSLGALAVMPIIGQALLGTDQLAIGGTSILILVAVALETLRQIESRALMVTYDDYTIDISSSSKKKKKNDKNK
ncbi:preprotein translocase subunit SecY [Candidatus Saccharibacteria bacterium]|nr:preprotein translocase subunit SecY [Candidatus Saccharibacteria bacterium]MDQ5885254.1 preprotein translocase subunit SecY [Patescibacteria group bacterium]MDQ5953778.1 preprotein translocase subunit SecY [Patescibacteria group bacterium]